MKLKEFGPLGDVHPKFYYVDPPLAYANPAKKLPQPSPPEERHVVTKEAEELGLSNREESKLLTNLMKCHFFLQNIICE